MRSGQRVSTGTVDSGDSGNVWRHRGHAQGQGLLLASGEQRPEVLHRATSPQSHRPEASRAEVPEQPVGQDLPVAGGSWPPHRPAPGAQGVRALCFPCLEPTSVPIRRGAPAGQGGDAEAPVSWEQLWLYDRQGMASDSGGKALSLPPAGATGNVPSVKGGALLSHPWSPEPSGAGSFKTSRRFFLPPRPHLKPGVEYVSQD